jgi:hypothetical protein
VYCTYTRSHNISGLFKKGRVIGSVCRTHIHFRSWMCIFYKSKTIYIIYPISIDGVIFDLGHLDQGQIG